MLQYFVQESDPQSVLHSVTSHLCLPRSWKCLLWLKQGGPGVATEFLRLDSVLLRRQSICLQGGRPGFNPWVRKIPWRRKWHPTPVLLPGKSHGQRNLVGYSPWSRKQSDTTKWLHFLLLGATATLSLFPLCLDCMKVSRIFIRELLQSKERVAFFFSLNFKAVCWGSYHFTSRSFLFTAPLEAPCKLGWCFFIPSTVTGAGLVQHGSSGKCKSIHRKIGTQISHSKR